MKSEFHTKIVGVTKKNDCDEKIQGLLKDIADYCYEGMPLAVEHERDNPYDENAIKVFCDGDHIGYINRDLAKDLAPFVDQGRVAAELCEITGGEDGKSYGCNVLINILTEGAASNRFDQDVLEVRGADYFRTLSNHDFSTWFARFLQWESELPADADPEILASAKRQHKILIEEIDRRERESQAITPAMRPVGENSGGEPGLFDRLIPVGSFREKALPIVCYVISFVVTLSVLFALFA